MIDIDDITQTYLAAHARRYERITRALIMNNKEPSAQDYRFFAASCIRIPGFPVEQAFEAALSREAARRARLEYAALQPLLQGATS